MKQILENLSIDWCDLCVKGKYKKPELKVGYITWLYRGH